MLHAICCLRVVSRDFNTLSKCVPAVQMMQNVCLDTGLCWDFLLNKCVINLLSSFDKGVFSENLNKSPKVKISGVFFLLITCEIGLSTILICGIGDFNGVAKHALWSCMCKKLIESKDSCVLIYKAVSLRFFMSCHPLTRRPVKLL